MGRGAVIKAQFPLGVHVMLPNVSQVLTKLYLDKATLVWNGNAVSGQAALAEFFEMLPSSDFQVTTFDCQPVHGKMPCQTV